MNKNLTSRPPTKGKKTNPQPAATFKTTGVMNKQAMTEFVMAILNWKAEQDAKAEQVAVTVEPA